MHRRDTSTRHTRNTQHSTAKHVTHVSFTYDITLSTHGGLSKATIHATANTPRHVMMSPSTPRNHKQTAQDCTPHIHNSYGARRATRAGPQRHRARRFTAARGGECTRAETHAIGSQALITRSHDPERRGNGFALTLHARAHRRHPHTHQLFPLLFLRRGLATRSPKAASA
jgi:hypothetical protein